MRTCLANLSCGGVGEVGKVAWSDWRAGRNAARSLCWFAAEICSLAGQLPSSLSEPREARTPLEITLAASPWSPIANRISTISTLARSSSRPPPTLASSHCKMLLRAPSAAPWSLRYSIHARAYAGALASLGSRASGVCSASAASWNVCAAASSRSGSGSGPSGREDVGGDSRARLAGGPGDKARFGDAWVGNGLGCDGSTGSDGDGLKCWGSDSEVITGRAGCDADMAVQSADASAGAAPGSKARSSGSSV